MHHDMPDEQEAAKSGYINPLKMMGWDHLPAFCRILYINTTWQPLPPSGFFCCIAPACKEWWECFATLQQHMLDTGAESSLLTAATVSLKKRLSERSDFDAIARGTQPSAGRKVEAHYWLI